MKGGWPAVKTRDYLRKTELVKIVEGFVEEDLLPMNGQNLFILQNAQTEEELAVYYPCIKKAICLSDTRQTLEEVFPHKEEVSLSFVEHTDIKVRYEEILPFTTEDLGKTTKEGKEKEATPYDKEKMIIELIMSVEEQTEKTPAGTGVQLWLYLLGFVLIMAFLVSLLVNFISFEEASNYSLLDDIFQKMLYLLLPAAVCFLAGKLAVVIGKKKGGPEKQEEKTETEVTEASEEQKK